MKGLIFLSKTCHRHPESFNQKNNIFKRLVQPNSLNVSKEMMFINKDALFNILINCFNFEGIVLFQKCHKQPESFNDYNRIKALSSIVRPNSSTF